MGWVGWFVVRGRPTGQARADGDRGLPEAAVDRRCPRRRTSSSPVVAVGRRLGEDLVERVERDRSWSRVVPDVQRGRGERRPARVEGDVEAAVAEPGPVGDLGPGLAAEAVVRVRDRARSSVPLAHVVPASPVGSLRGEVAVVVGAGGAAELVVGRDRPAAGVVRRDRRLARARDRRARARCPADAGAGDPVEAVVGGERVVVVGGAGGLGDLGRPTGLVVRRRRRARGRARLLTARGPSPEDPARGVVVRDRGHGRRARARGRLEGPGGAARRRRTRSRSGDRRGRCSCAGCPSSSYTSVAVSWLAEPGVRGVVSVSVLAECVVGDAW